MPEKDEMFPELDQEVYDFLCSCLEADKEKRLATYDKETLIALSANWRLNQI